MNSFKKQYEVTKREPLYQGVFSLSRYHIRHALFNGGWSEVIARELLERKSAVGVLPYDPILDQVVLIEQFRPGPVPHKANPWLIEIVAGVYEEKEKPEQAAERETVEEAGCTILDSHPISDYFVSPGGSNEHIYLFCGRVDASKATGIHGLAEEHEDIRAFALSAEDAFAMWQRGEIKTGPASVSLLWLQIHRPELRKKWKNS